MLALALGAALLGAWELYVGLGGIDELLLPAPSAIAAALVDDRALLFDDFVVTAQELLLGLLCAVAAALLVAVPVHLVRPLRRAVHPLLIGSQVLPIALLAPLLVAWFGFGLLPKLVTVALVCFFPIAVATIDGLAAVDADQRRFLASLGASRWQLLRFVELPGAVPRIVTGARVSVAIAAIAAYLAEQTGASDGLGYRIDIAIPNFETARAWAAVVVLSLFVLLVYAALGVLERRLAPWAAPTRPLGGPHP